MGAIDIEKYKIRPQELENKVHLQKFLFRNGNILLKIFFYHIIS